MAKRELILSEESAQAQLDLFFDWYDIDFDDMIEEAKASRSELPIKTIRKKIVRAIKQGRVEIKEATVGDEPSLQVYQHLDHAALGKDSIVYKEVTGRARAASKTIEDANDTARMYQFLGILTGEGSALFDRLRGADIGATDAVGILFLMV